MDTQFCQSCSMPLQDAGLLGTEKDGSPASDYCRYCYRQGNFNNPDMTLEEMRALIIDKMEKQKIPPDIIEAAVARLPSLKRWKSKSQL